MCGLLAGPARAQAPVAAPAGDGATPAEPLALQPSRSLRTGSRPGASDRLPVFLDADHVSAQPDLDALAEGNAVLRRGPLQVSGDRLRYEPPTGIARANGRVEVRRGGDVFRGPELQLQLQRFEGWFLQPDYFFEVTGGGGQARRIDFIDQDRVQALDATYTSCPRDGSGDPDWLLSTDRVRMDFDSNTGVAENGVLRFKGVPILAAPRLSFPLTDARKSGWLPPLINLDSRSGAVVGVPYYWNIAPNRDMTLTPTLLTRRGVSLDTEFRYLEPGHEGRINYALLPHDQETGRSRQSLRLQQEGAPTEGRLAGLYYKTNVFRVSDDDYWKDFPRALRWVTPRLLPTDLQGERGLQDLLGTTLNADWTAYARLQRWQVVQDVDPASRIVSPYERSPQVGVRARSRLAPATGGAFSGLQFSLQTEYNRFTLSDPANAAPGALTGDRVHALADIALPLRLPGGWLTPKLMANAASYRTDQAMSDGRTSASRIIPTASVDAGLVFEREATLFDRGMRQTLEPRLLYVNTPYRDQSRLPRFDAAGKDFNDLSIFTENDFSGVDRVSDAHQLTAGGTTRWLDEQNGAEVLRLGLAQRLLFRDQRVTPAGVPFTQSVSDLLLLGSTRLWPSWTLDAALQYSPQTDRVQRSLASVRYSPGPWRTVNVTHRLTRGLSEQMELGWQWPLFGPEPSATGRPPPSAGGSCGGTWYTVGRLNYSLRDRRLTDSLAGIEYDAGCWIARVVTERLSTGRAQATTRLMLQLELVGLSRLGTNPLQALRDNIPGYRLLREPRNTGGLTGSIYD
ncbi:LPS-assembly protein LptD [Aquabacterium sp. J223]|uniref:LPS-assembly protein LptD n=1 Tax=Aquabacterium sp. J223 TaxID=2898431 RepID=UPI0021AE0415|nr:LPS assembly protein LptD [Aquabacterium sp. J223]UUX96020.1 LPS assembly protein LptD [Aquabacterium sp. J223]